jgi:hypothetical protein
VELGLATVVAIVVGPFVIGWWVGHPLFAAAVFVAMAFTVALGSVARGDDGSPALGLALSLLLSAGSAAAGGYLREKRRTRRADRG